jgi:hypothetical protein
MPGGISYIGDLTIVEDGGEITSQAIGNKALKSTCADADTIEVNSSTGVLQIKEAGTSKSNGVQRDDMGKTAGFWIRGALTASDAAGGVFSSENSYGTDIIITRVLIMVTTGASGACKLDIGVAADGTTSAATLIDELDVADAGVFDNIADKGSAGSSRLKFGNGAFVNGSMSAGATAGLVGSYAIHCIDILS